MILIDVNLLIFGHDRSSPYHTAACRWLTESITEGPPVALFWVTILAFLRITTNSRLARPVAMADSLSAINAMLVHSNVRLLEPGHERWSILNRLLMNVPMNSSLVMDAHLATLAIEHNATLATHDRDFARFPGLRTFNPLA